VRHERAGLDPSDRLADVGLQVRERLHGERRPETGFGFDLALEAVVAEGQHPAVGVMDDQHLARAQQPLRDQQRADHVLGHDAARVADDVRLALLQAEQAVHVQARVHAGDDGDGPGRAVGQVTLGEPGRVGAVPLEQLVGVAQPISS
jgi:hypothetical protein